MVTLESAKNILDQDYNNLVFLKIDPIKPEQAKSVEFGYRTTLFDKLYLDANYYYSQYTDFIGYKIGVKFKWFETVLPLFNDTINSISLQSMQAYRIAANAENTVTTQGASIGLNYFLNPSFTINGNCCSSRTEICFNCRYAGGRWKSKCCSWYNSRSFGKRFKGYECHS